MLRQTFRSRVHRILRARRAPSLNVTRRAHTSTPYANARRPSLNRADLKLPLTGLAGSVIAGALVCSFAIMRPALNEATMEEQTQPNKSTEPAPLVWDDEQLLALAWGSNRDGLLSPTQPDVERFRSPTSVPWLRDVALRDLALHERYGVCVDGQGDVYQWDAESKGPVLALSGKDVVTVQAAPSRIFALSSSGRIYVFPSDLKANIVERPSSSSWSPVSWSSSGPPRDYITLQADQRLGWGEKFTSISAGNEHLLALTSKGRTFAYPMSKDANSYGQLGIRRISLPKRGDPRATDRVKMELIPKAVADPYANVSRTQRLVASRSEELTDESVASKQENSDIGSCDRLFEIPSLRGINVTQAVASARSSFVRTEEEGRVLAWGANEYGQLGLGATMTVDTITIPTEVIFSRNTPLGTRSRCIDIKTGGDLVFFTVERRDGSFISSFDLLGCGMGQWGGLGNGRYSTAQGEPSRVRAASGLLEFNEKTQNLQPIMPHAISISPTGHVLLTLETLSRAGPGTPAVGGRDLLVWGANRECQLGNGKRASLATPTTLELPGLPGGGGPDVEVAEKATGVNERGRLMLVRRRAKEIKDLQGRRWKRNVDVEQCAVAGWGSTLIYWRFC